MFCYLYGIILKQLKGVSHVWPTRQFIVRIKANYSYYHNLQINGLIYCATTLLTVVQKQRQNRLLAAIQPSFHDNLAAEYTTTRTVNLHLSQTVQQQLIATTPCQLLTDTQEQWRTITTQRFNAKQIVLNDAKTVAKKSTTTTKKTVIMMMYGCCQVQCKTAVMLFNPTQTLNSFIIS